MASNSNMRRSASAAQTADASGSSGSEARKRTGTGNTSASDTIVDGFAESREERQIRDRAIAILTNHQLMMRYALANDVVSASCTRARRSFYKYSTLALTPLCR